MGNIKIHDKEFGIFITGDRLQEVIERMAGQINKDLVGKEVFFIGVLNGAFMFAGDLIRRLRLRCQVSFVKLASYAGDASTGKVDTLIGIQEDLRDKTVVILEDIVDTGTTLEEIIRQLRAYEPGEIRVATLLLKPDTFRKEVRMDYVGMEIPPEFVIGFGLDYMGYGRNLKDIYRVIAP